MSYQSDGDPIVDPGASHSIRPDEDAAAFAEPMDDEAYDDLPPPLSYAVGLDPVSGRPVLRLPGGAEIEGPRPADSIEARAGVSDAVADILAGEAEPELGDPVAALPRLGARARGEELRPEQYRAASLEAAGVPRAKIARVLGCSTGAVHRWARESRPYRAEVARLRGLVEDQLAARLVAASLTAVSVLENVASDALALKGERVGAAKALLGCVGAVRQSLGPGARAASTVADALAAALADEEDSAPVVSALGYTPDSGKDPKQLRCADPVGADECEGS